MIRCASSFVVNKVRHLLFLHPVAKTPLDVQMLIFLLRFSRDDLKEKKMNNLRTLLK